MASPVPRAQLWRWRWPGMQEAPRSPGTCWRTHMHTDRLMDPVGLRRAGKWDKSLSFSLAPPIGPWGCGVLWGSLFLEDPLRRVPGGSLLGPFNALAFVLRLDTAVETSCPPCKPEPLCSLGPQGSLCPGLGAPQLRPRCGPQLLPQGFGGRWDTHVCCFQQPFPISGSRLRPPEVSCPQRRSTSISVTGTMSWRTGYVGLPLKIGPYGAQFLKETEAKQELRGLSRQALWPVCREIPRDPRHSSASLPALTLPGSWPTLPGPRAASPRLPTPAPWSPGSPSSS